MGKMSPINLLQILLKSEARMKIHLRTTSIPYVVRFLYGWIGGNKNRISTNY